MESKDPPPLVVDLDGTLARTDTMHEQALTLVKARPLRTLLLPAWLIRGKAHLKQQLAQEATLDVDTLPYNEVLLGRVIKPSKSWQPPDGWPPESC